MGFEKPQDKQAEAEQGFRSSLHDVLAVVKGLSHLCGTIADMEEVVTLALDNDAQLRFLMRAVLDKAGQKR